jgi:hypothetical protein
MTDEEAAIDDAYHETLKSMYGVLLAGLGFTGGEPGKPEERFEAGLILAREARLKAKEILRRQRS